VSVNPDRFVVRKAQQTNRRMDGTSAGADEKDFVVDSIANLQEENKVSGCVFSVGTK